MNEEAELKDPRPPLVSLLVCTYNRAEMLEETLDSLLGQQFDLGDFEVIVIDNASTDNTHEMVQARMATDRRLRYVHEPRLGVAIARNTGARASEALYVAYFDDDLVAEPDCLQHLMQPFLSLEPKPKAVMGKVDLQWEGDRPDWFPEQFETLLSRFDRGDLPRYMRKDEYLLTMNVVFERQSLLESGGIREDLSRKGRMFICGGDNEVFHRYMKLGWPVYYEPRALVAHLVPKSRQTKRWLQKRLFGDGTTQAVLFAPDKNRSAFAREVYIDIRRCTRFALEAVWGALQANPKLTENARYRFIQRAGRLFAHWNLLIGNDPRTSSES